MDAIIFRIVDIIVETKDTKSFYLEPANNSIVHYEAGQFLTLLFNRQNREIRRSYSLASAPFVDKRLFITVKRKPNGEISRMLLDEYHVGDILRSLPPSGRFTIHEPVADTHIFVAAGSGITPVFGLMKELLFHHASKKVVLINQSRSENDIIYKKQLRDLHEEFKERIEVIQLFSRPISGLHSPVHLTNEMLERIIREKNNEGLLSAANFYICGPIPFMRMAEFTLKMMGFSSGQIRKEYFVVDRPVRVPLMSDTAEKKVTLHFQGKKYQFEVAYPETILDASLKNQIELPYSCKAGRCSSCAAHCTQGRVVMSVNEVLTDEDLAEGLVLLCVGHAATDVEIHIH